MEDFDMPYGISKQLAPMNEIGRALSTALGPILEDLGQGWGLWRISTFQASLSTSPICVVIALVKV